MKIKIWKIIISLTILMIFAAVKAETIEKNTNIEEEAKNYKVKESEVLSTVQKSKKLRKEVSLDESTRNPASATDKEMKMLEELDAIIKE